VVESEEAVGEGVIVGGEEDAALRDRAGRLIRRYLDLLRDALLDQHYLENEVRIEYLLECISTGNRVEEEKLANPARQMIAALRRKKQEREAGDLGTATSEALAYAAVGRVRLDHLEGCLDVIRNEGVEGDLVEAGTGRGGTAIFMRGYLDVHDVPDRRVWVADRFDGSRPGGEPARFPPDLNTVREAFASFDLLDERVVFLQGQPSQVLDEPGIDEVALLRLDSRDPGEVRAVLDALYDRVAPGGFVVVDGYGDDDCRASVESFRADRGILEALERVDASAAAWRKTPDGDPDRAPGTARVDLEARPAATKDLGVVVVVYNMRREAERTLHSLSRSYQRGVDDVDYEVIVVDNGSDPEQRLGQEFVRGFGPEFLYVDLAGDARPSPATAINRGIAASSARNLALMIDGAHLLTPGVLHFGMLGLAAYAPAIVTAKQWYLGPGQQPLTTSGGYDRKLEDGLLDEIGWPTDGYRLFEIGHFIGDRDWFDGEWESNCIFLPRALLEQVGAMDESFSEPGGGFVNLDFFERMAGTPGVTTVTMLGEGSFHQVHGGTTTNALEPDDLIDSYDDHYEELRGRRFQIPPQRTHYVGSLSPAARRTKTRRLNSFERFRNAHSKVSDHSLSQPMPVPEELKLEFIDAFWRSGEWHRTPWLGRSTHTPPTDLLAYQELIYRVRPEWIVETRTGVGGRALFLASICDLIDHGQVLSIDEYPLAHPPSHPRITYVRGDPEAERTTLRVREIVGERPLGLLILGGAAGPKLTGVFGKYASLVPVGSYVVVEDTILGGHPVWPDFGAGPRGVAQTIIDGGDFVADPSLERFSLTFNPGGFLKRIR
jgi:cephalosporin hydroxylase